MADRFGADPTAVVTAAGELTRIRSSLGTLADFAGQGGVTGSGRVQQALEDFVRNSSDARQKLDSGLERATGLLSGLAEGATTLDGSLAQAVTVDTPVTGVAPTIGEAAS